jgi:hypothetical protein
MKSALPFAVVILCCTSSLAQARIEKLYTLGEFCKEAPHIVVVEITRVNKEKNLILYKKVRDLKGKHPTGEIKHNIGKRGYHEREWKGIMAWAEVGKRAVFFHNGQGSELCIGDYWYQCFKEGDWWGMSHAEPYLLRTYCGEAGDLTAAVEGLLQGREVVVPCMADGNKEELQLRKGKLQRLKASANRLDYNLKRDFVGWGKGESKNIEEEFKRFVLLDQSTPGWKYMPRNQVGGEGWRNADFDDRKWHNGKAPIGYGETEIVARKGTTIPEKGQPFLFRRIVNVSSDLLNQKAIAFQLRVASDDNAAVYLNGVPIDRDPAEDHEFRYWNREVEVPAKHFKPGRNILAVLVKNQPGSSDLYLDMELSVRVPLPKLVRRVPSAAAATAAVTSTSSARKPLPDAPGKPQAVSVDKRQRTVAIPCAIALRKLPNLKESYPIEVIATYPAPQGQKAHETVVSFTGIKPSEVHKALVGLGLKPGKPARGENAKAEGPELLVFLEIAGRDGKVQRLPIGQTLVDRKTGKPIGDLKWHFTGSAFRQPDPEKDDKVYGADLTGTLIALFPVTDDTVIQSHLTMKDEPILKLETNGKRLPKEGTAARLILQVK